MLDSVRINADTIAFAPIETLDYFVFRLPVLVFFVFPSLSFGVILVD
jgi:hypothetical protein